MWNLFFKLFIGYRSKPGQTRDCQLSLTTSSLTHLLPTLRPSHCVHLFQAALFFCWHMDTSYPLFLNKTLWQWARHSFSSCAWKQLDCLPSDIHHIQSSNALKIVLKTPLYKQYYNEWLKIGSFSFCKRSNPPSLPLYSLGACAYMHVCMHVRVCGVWGIP